MKPFNKWYKYLFILALSLFSINVSAHRMIANFADLENVLQNGHEVRAIIAMNKCTSDSKETQMHSVGGFNFTNFNHYTLQKGSYSKATIATSIHVLTQHNQLGIVYNYVRLRIFEDNSADIFVDFLDPKTYSSIKSLEFHCHLSNGKDDNSIRLYDLT